MCGGGCVEGVCAWQGACVAGGMHGKGVCMARGAWQGGMCGRGHAWQGGVHGKGGMAGEHVWQGACMAGGVHGGGGGVHAMHTPRHYEIHLVNVWAVRVLLECILILNILVAKNHEDDPVKSTTKCNPVIQAYGTRHVLSGGSLN